MRPSGWLRPIQNWLQYLRIGLSLRVVGAAIRGIVRHLRQRRVPVVLQLNALECGAACVAMILNYYGRRTRVSECREACGVGRDGVTAQVIASTARSFGLRVKAYSIEPADFKYMRLPAVIHWNFTHFMVLERWTPSQVVVIDPASGLRRLSAKEFDEGFTGVVLTFEPSIHFRTASKPTAGLWRRYLASVLNSWKTLRVLAQILAASLLLQGLGLIIPVLTKVLIDQIVPLRITNLLTILGLGIAILVVAQLVLGYLRTALLIYLQAHLDIQMMLGFFEHLLMLPFRFFQQRTSGDLMMRLGSNNVLREALTSQTIAIILDGSFVLTYLIILLSQAPLFGLLVLGLGLIQVAILFGTTHRIRHLTQHSLITQATSQSYLFEALKGIATLRAAGAEERVLDHWSNLHFDELNVVLRKNHLLGAVDTSLAALRMYSPLMLLWIGALFVIQGSMSLGTMLALNALAAAFLAPITSLLSTARQLQLAGAHLDRIIDVIEAQPEQDFTAVQQAPPLSGRIELREVSFQYDPNGPHVLRDISLTIAPGQKLAIVGRSGSGKSTLAMLLLGFYSPTSGEILYDDIPLQNVHYRTLRRQLGAVLQESFLFSGSIRHNIAFNDPTLPLERVMEAAELAGIHDEIMRMPMGYETVLTEGGGGLSGGQRQRLSIARALAHTPTILLLDEATSHLDVVTERLIDQNLSKLSCTRIVIAHRLSTIHNADLILVVDQGQIVEQGQHDELFALDELYSTLVRNQSSLDYDKAMLPASMDPNVSSKGPPV